jgi:hypothetical protein
MYVYVKSIISICQAEGRVRALVSQSVICYGQSDTVSGFSPSWRMNIVVVVVVVADDGMRL